jgi:hypothetical protein
VRQRDCVGISVGKRMSFAGSGVTASGSNQAYSLPSVLDDFDEDAISNH